MTKQTEALKLALEALNSFPAKHLTPFISSARTALREALAEESSGTEQPERHELQKDGKHPAPCARFCEATAFNIEIRGLRKRLAEQPAQRKPWVRLTDEDHEQAIKVCLHVGVEGLVFWLEDKLKEKNT